MGEAFAQALATAIIIPVSLTALVVVMLGGAPIDSLFEWLSERENTKRILAEARLQEAKNAARSTPGGPDA